MKRFAIMMILILIQQTVLSQTVITDTINKTITLDRKAAIDKAKIIANEEALFQENKLLKETIAQLEIINASQARDLEIYKKEILKRKDDIISLQNSIISNNEKVSDISKGSSDFGLYMKTGYTTERFGGLNIGASLVKQRFLVGALFNPKNQETNQSSFTFLVGFKLF